jgi:hypothetical protein
VRVVEVDVVCAELSETGFYGCANELAIAADVVADPGFVDLGMSAPH